MGLFHFLFSASSHLPDIPGAPSDLMKYSVSLGHFRLIINPNVVNPVATFVRSGYIVLRNFSEGGLSDRGLQFFFSKTGTFTKIATFDTDHW